MSIAIIDARAEGGQGGDVRDPFRHHTIMYYNMTLTYNMLTQ